MNRKTLYITLLAIVLFACGQEDSPPLAISNISVFAPLPGSGMSVAYLTLTNNTDADIVVSHISSPEFASVELHETRIRDGVARMQSLDRVTVPGRSEIVFAEGGKHIMLMSPRSPLTLNQLIDLQINYGSRGLVMVSATLQPRIQLEDR